MKKSLTMAAALALAGAVCAQAQTVTVLSTAQLTDSAAFFPQLSPDGTRLLYSNTEASRLTLRDVATGGETVVCGTGFPGFDARFAPNGKVYYITQSRSQGNLIYRTGHEYDPRTGRGRTVLKAQHGAVRPVECSRGFALVGESRSWATGGNVGLGAYTAGAQVVTFRGKPKFASAMTPVSGTVGCLWASYSPDGTKLMFEAAAKGLYVIDLKRHTITNLGFYLMPSWLGNDYVVAMTNNNSAVRHFNGYKIVLLKADGKYSRDIAPEGHIQPSCRTVSVAPDGTAVGRVVYTTSHGTVSMQQIEVKP